jgi:hypothetical protein
MRILVAALFLVIVACGDDDAAGTLAEGPTYEETIAASEALVARWDDRLAFYAVIASFDLGYSTEQVIAGHEGLSADGTIDGVVPVGPPLGLLSPLPASSGGAPGGVLAAPRRILAVAGDGLSPENQYIDFIDATLGEVFDAGMARLQEETDFQQSVVEMTILLGSAGYSPGQIVEALILGTWGIEGPCFVIVDGAHLVTPTRLASKFVDLVCPGVFNQPTTSTLTSTTTTAGSSDGSVDGNYQGTVDLAFPSIPSFGLLEGTVDVEIDQGLVAMTVDYTIGYTVRFFNDDPTCDALVRYVFIGSGTADGETVQVELAPDELEILSLEGSECGTGPNWDTTARADITAEWAGQAPVTFRGTISNGVLSGGVGEEGVDFLVISAAKR